VALGSVLAACGGSVETAPGSPGAGGSSTSTGAAADGAGGGVPPSTSVSTPGDATTASTGSGAGPDALCAAICEKLARLCGPEDNCAHDCIDIFDDIRGCDAEIAVFLECVNEHLTSCDPGDFCEDERDAIGTCVSAGCTPAECAGGSTSGGEISCDCTSQCPNGVVEEACTSNGGAAICTCLLNGQTVGTCTEMDAFQCDPVEGCCAEFSRR
jgi:hypothetical protein